MPIILKKHQVAQRNMFRDVRPGSVRFAESISSGTAVMTVSFGLIAALFLGPPQLRAFADLIALAAYFYLRWALHRPFALPFKFPRYAHVPDPNNPPPGKVGSGPSDGVLYLGNVSDKDDDDFHRELWLTNTDARTHILYLGTTGSGKTAGLKGMVTNALAWGSGFAYTDGKADTDLWADLYSLTRRFGRDDDILILNYMTGNSDEGSTSNSMNPFSNGSASYIANLVVGLMPDAGGDNAMWKERAVALMFALAPALTHKRDKQGMMLDVGVIRDHLELQPIIRLSRDKTMPARIVHGLEGYLNTLPGFVAAAFDDDGNERPPSPDQPMYDLQVARQQHGYLSMQFTRAMQSLADEYGYIFKTQLADIDMLDVVLNRRILVVLIPALEKAEEEAANLGKIVASCLKGMMGATLGNTVEGGWESAIGSKQARSNNSFMTVFDEVGYYTTSGMAVMAAQARSLGFALVFASQDLPAMEKRVKTASKSIVGNCNLKILGRIEDPTETKEFVTRHGGGAYVVETKGFTGATNTVGSLFMSMPYHDDRGAGIQARQRIDYDHLRGQREGEAHLIFGDWACKAQMFYALPEKAKALRVHRFLPVPNVTKATEMRDRAMLELASRLQDKQWTAAAAAPEAKEVAEISTMTMGVSAAGKGKMSPVEMGLVAVAAVGSLPAAAKSAVVDDAAETPVTTSGKSKTGFRPQVEDEDSDMPVAARTKVAARSYGDETPASERAAVRLNLPPLYEGDEFAIGDLESAPAAATRTGATGKSSGGTGAFTGTDSDLAAVVPGAPGFAAGEDFASVTLPDAVKAALAQSAQHINDGLRGKGEGK